MDLTSQPAPAIEPVSLVEMGIPQGDGVIAAFIPNDGSMLAESLYVDGKREFTAFHHDEVLLDLFPLLDSKNVKWWVVKQAARDLSLNVIEPCWHGPAEEFKLSNIPRTSQKPGTVLAIRQYTRGPWLTLEKVDDSTEPDTKTDDKNS